VAETPRKSTVYLLLILGIWACSTAVIWIRLSDVPPLLLSGWRLILSTLILSPLAWKAWQQASPEQRRHALLGTILPGIALAAHFISWTFGARMTEAARATLIVNMTPLAMPFVLWLVNREHVNRGEWIGTLVALAGVLMLTLPRLDSGLSTTAGDWVCFGSMILVTFYLVLGRRSRSKGAFWLYLVPVYAWAGLFCLLAALPFHAGEIIPESSQWILLLALAVIPTIVGHGLLNYSLRHTGAQQVSVFNQTQFLFAALIAFFVFSEIPGLLFYPAALLIVIGAWITAKSLPE